MHIGPGNDRTQRAAILLDDDAPFRAFLTSIRRVWADLVATESRLAHGAVGTLPLPLNAAQFVALLDQHRPDLLHHSVVAPPLKPTVDRTVVAKLFRQAIPLTARSHPEDDPVEDLPPIGSWPPPFGRRWGWGIPQEDGLNPSPEFVRDFPDRCQRLDHPLLASHRGASLLLLIEKQQAAEGSNPVLR